MNKHLLRAIGTLFSNRTTYFVISFGIYRTTVKLLTYIINLIHGNQKEAKEKQQFRLPREQQLQYVI